MSDLVAIVFNEKHRASKIFYQLRYESEKILPNLRSAIVFIADESRSTTIEQSINLDNRESSGWARFWGAFIGVTMLTPFYYNSTNFIDQIEFASSKTISDIETSVPTEWWTNEIGLSTNVMRDLKALLLPNTSAILMIANDQHDTYWNISDFSDASIIRIRLNNQQINKIREIFW